MDQLSSAGFVTQVQKDRSTGARYLWSIGDEHFLMGNAYYSEVRVTRGQYFINNDERYFELDSPLVIHKLFDVVRNVVLNFIAADGHGLAPRI